MDLETMRKRAADELERPPGVITCPRCGGVALSPACGFCNGVGKVEIVEKSAPFAADVLELIKEVERLQADAKAGKRETNMMIEALHDGAIERDALKAEIERLEARLLNAHRAGLAAAEAAARSMRTRAADVARNAECQRSGRDTILALPIVP
jgi:hypothetical protein